MNFAEFEEELDFLECSIGASLSLLLENKMDHDFIRKALSGSAVLKSKDLMNKRVHKQKLKTFVSDILLLHLSQIMDKFEIFLKSFLKEVYLDTPDLLSEISLSKIDMSFVLKAKTTKEITDHILENFINDLLYLNFDSFISHLKLIQKKNSKNLIAPLDADLLKTTKRIRNLVVHQNGIVTKDFIQNGFNGKKIGVKYEMTLKEFYQRSLALRTVAHGLHMASPTTHRKIAMNFWETLSKVTSL